MIVNIKDYHVKLDEIVCITPIEDINDWRQKFEIIFKGGDWIEIFSETHKESIFNNEYQKSTEYKQIVDKFIVTRDKLIKMWVSHNIKN